MVQRRWTNDLQRMSAYTQVSAAVHPRSAERRRWRPGTSATGVQRSDKYCGAIPCKHLQTVTHSRYWTWSGTSSQWRSWRRACIIPWSNFRMFVRTRAAPFMTHWSLSVVVLGTPVGHFRLATKLARHLSGQLQATRSKLLTYCLPRPTQPAILNRTKMSSSLAREGCGLTDQCRWLRCGVSAVFREIWLSNVYEPT